MAPLAAYHQALSKVVSAKDIEELLATGDWQAARAALAAMCASADARSLSDEQLLTTLKCDPLLYPLALRTCVLECSRADDGMPTARLARFVVDRWPDLRSALGDHVDILLSALAEAWSVGDVEILTTRLRYFIPPLIGAFDRILAEAIQNSRASRTELVAVVAADLQAAAEWYVADLWSAELVRSDSDDRLICTGASIKDIWSKRRGIFGEVVPPLDLQAWLQWIGLVDQLLPRPTPAGLDALARGLDLSGKAYRLTPTQSSSSGCCSRRGRCPANPRRRRPGPRRSRPVR